MKRIRLVMAFLLAVGMFSVPTRFSHASAKPAPLSPQVIDVSIFYDQLSPYGRWVSVQEYGNVWIPAGIEAGWRPYSHGHWVYTDYDWTWVSDYDWGWAPFHYGRWAFEAGYGWIWVPGTVWGPAWVAWRNGPGYIGWAPLPPQVVWTVGVGFGAFDFDRGIQPGWFCFVDERRFTEVRLDRIIEVPARNVTIFRATQDYTHYSFENNRVFNRGIEIAHVQQVTGHAVSRVRIVDARSVADARGAKTGGLAFYRPQISDRAPSRGPTGTNVRQETNDQRDKRQAQERENLEQQKIQEKTQLEKQHQAEIDAKRPVKGQTTQTAQDVRTKQENEHSAHDARWQQEQQAMQNRHDMERQGKLPPPPKPQPRPQTVTQHNNAGNGGNRGTPQSGTRGKRN